MALLTAEEKAKLAKEGIWVREKCDVCHKPILSPVTYLKKNLTMCSSCATGSDSVIKNVKEENVMAKQKAEKKAQGKAEVETKKVGGYLIAGTALADMYEVLSDEKKHPFSELKKVCAKHKKDLTGRLGNLRRVGEKKKAWALIVDTEAATIQMKLGSHPVPPLKKKVAKEEPEEKPEKKASAKKTNSHAKDDEAESSSKATKAAATLIRRTLKSKTDWTRNKLTEHLVDDIGMDPDVVKQALNAEIKAGGIEVNNGILQLA